MLNWLLEPYKKLTLLRWIVLIGGATVLYFCVRPEGIVMPLLLGLSWGVVSQFVMDFLEFD